MAIPDHILRLLAGFQLEWTSQRICAERAGGQTNQNFIVQVEGRQFFARLPWEHEGILDRRVEGENVRAMSRNALAQSVVPQCLMYVLDGRNILAPDDGREMALPDGAMLTEYMEGCQLDGELLSQPKVQEAVVRALHAFHSSGVEFVNPYDVFRDEVVKYRETAYAYPVSELFGADTRIELGQLEEEAEAHLRLTDMRISTHNDLSFDNLLLNSQVLATSKSGTHLLRRDQGDMAVL